MTEHNIPVFTEDSIARVEELAVSAFQSATSSEELRDAKSAHLDESSELAAFTRALKTLPGEQKAVFGKSVTQARARVTTVFRELLESFESQEFEQKLREESIDVTAAADRLPRGARHPLSMIQEHICDIFRSMSWHIETGPELENEWFNFDALNFDEDHPARAMQDTFFVEPSASKFVLRTHTSPVQIRTMLNKKPPLYILSPGRVFRTDELDATHTPVFTQIEGLAVDKGLTMAHLKGTLEHFARALFGSEAKIRLRPSFFPFTEPSAELDVWCEDFPGGAKWIEWGGCGMINHNVLRSVGIDPEEFGGFAFGMGVERTLMFRNAVSDMRDLVEGDVRFSQQFGGVI